MATDTHHTSIYVGLAGEGQYMAEGGLYRYHEGEGVWRSMSEGLPHHPQVRALLVHPTAPAVLYAGTQDGIYRSDDRGEHWEVLDAPRQGMDVWSLAFHPQNPEILYAGYEPCAIYRSEDGGAHWKQMHTAQVVFPHITTYMHPVCKRVIGITADPSQPLDMYAAIEVGGLLVSRDGGDSWTSAIDGPFVRNNTLDLHGVQVSPATPGTVYIITQIAMFRSRDRAQHWEHVPFEDMFTGGTYCRGLLVDPGQPRTLYLAAGAGGGGAPAGTQEAGALFRSRDTGEHWERVDIGETPPSRMAQIAVDLAAPSHVYCCAQRGQVYMSHDSGATWTKTQVPVEMSRSLHIYPMVCG
ncbi:MAG: WD40/YVTN/BNR-like repeat-containing protein [Candidatus Tectimicrobiota bacterium]